jgi:hypothetical protein
VHCDGGDEAAVVGRGEWEGMTDERKREEKKKKSNEEEGQRDEQARGMRWW